MALVRKFSPWQRPLYIGILVALGFAATGFSLVSGWREAAPKVLMISIDGLRPEFYLDEKFETPFLKSLKLSGAFAEASIPVFPSVTYPNHTTLITGVPPAVHGVLSNTVFNWETGPTAAWYWEAQHIKVPTLLQQSREQGLTTAALRWPVTLKGEATYLVPEIFKVEGFYEGEDWDLTQQYTEASLAAELTNNVGVNDFSTVDKVDQWVTDAGVYLQKQYSPNLMLVHLANVDHIEHDTGRDSAETLAAVKLADQQVRALVSSVDMNNTCVFIVGDHGFFDVNQAIRPNVLFAKQGWIQLDDKGQIKEWTVIAHASGGQAAIYTKDASLVPEIEKILEDNAGTIYRVLNKSTLEHMKVYPEAVGAISAFDGYTISGTAEGDKLVTPTSLKGQHGHMPDNPKLYTGFIASGCGIKAGQDLGWISNLQVAPTVARILHLTLDPSAQGEISLQRIK